MRGPVRALLFAVFVVFVAAVVVGSLVRLFLFLLSTPGLARPPTAQRLTMHPSQPPQVFSANGLGEGGSPSPFRDKTLKSQSVLFFASSLLCRSLARFFPLCESFFLAPKEPPNPLFLSSFSLISWRKTRLYRLSEKRGGKKERKKGEKRDKSDLTKGSAAAVAAAGAGTTAAAPASSLAVLSRTSCGETTGGCETGPSAGVAKPAVRQVAIAISCGEKEARGRERERQSGKRRAVVRVKKKRK